jgi:hypothetical protein
MIDAAYLKAHRTASSLRAKKRGPDDQRGRLIGRTKAGLNTKLHAVTDAKGRPLKVFMTAGPPLGDAGSACRATGQRRDRSRRPAEQFARRRMDARALSRLACKPLPGNGPEL